MTTTETTVTTQVYRIYIKTSPERVFEAITKPEWTERYGYGGRTDFDLTPGARFETHPSRPMIDAARENGYDMPDVIIDGEVVESDPPRRLVLTWRMLMDPEMAKEGFSRLTYDILEVGGASRLTITHELENTPKLALVVDGSQEELGAGGGWPWVLSDLKSLLETGNILAE